MSGFIHLILGGARSGKSRRAETLATASGKPVTYVATYATSAAANASAADPEMQARILHHRASRPAQWRTIENRFDLAAVFAACEDQTVLVDCLTLWLSHLCESRTESELLTQLEEALAAARARRLHLILVSNELGMGLVPTSPQGRAFRDLCGRTNQRVAHLADAVELVVAGLPLALKGVPSA